MKKVILIDDEPLARSLVKEYLDEFTDFEIVATCGDGFEGIKAINEHQPDLIFLDIQMPKINGFEVLELLSSPPAVIFTTAFDEYAIQAFENNAVDYLLKPFSKERFDKAIQKLLLQTNQHKNQIKKLLSEPVMGESQNRIVVKTGNKIKVIPVNHVIYLKADDDYVSIKTAEGDFLKSKTLAYFEQTLNNEFVRIHRSYIVKIDQITSIQPYEKDSHQVLLRSGEKLPVSKSGYPKLREVLGL